MDLIVISFAGGAVVAALVFWPILRRARLRAHADAPPTGKHALRPAQPAAARPAPQQPAPEAPAAEARPEPAAIPRQAIGDEGEQPARAEPELGVTVSTLPTALFEEHHAAKFRRTRDRIERLRTQLHEQN
ncbi:hypothetical protein ACL03H_13730 [Saccharopolyspora sp. MS10]|uniref:hypothetical protein n=1 Tax=Saccharopolyspora sp. MS10 TaxID=3385973 RepID=UPI0039A22FC4